MKSHKRTFGSVTVLYSFDIEAKFSDMCSKEEVLEEGFAILEDRGLQLSAYAKDDVKWLWRDHDNLDADRELAQMAVREIGRELRDIRVICWLYEWYCRYGELREISRIRPSNTDYALFFTIRDLLGYINLKNTSFCKCVEHLRKLGLRSLKDGGGDQASKMVREYMRSHPEVVEEVKRKQEEGGC